MGQCVYMAVIVSPECDCHGVVWWVSVVVMMRCVNMVVLMWWVYVAMMVWCMDVAAWNSVWYGVWVGYLATLTTHKHKLMYICVYLCTFMYS